MQNILIEAQKHFESLLELLKSNATKDESYFTKLSIDNEEAYVFMNQSMCSSDSVCKECAIYRDFIREMLEVLSDLELDASKITEYTSELEKYTNTIESIVTNIKTALNQ